MVHIQNASEAAFQIPHWGYASRSFPCTNDAGSCEYLDAVYWMHDVSMLYTFIMWAVIGGILVLWMLSRLFPRQSRQLAIEKPEEGALQEPPQQALLYRSRAAIAASCRKYLLPEAFGSFFGHVTRLQILILAILLGYLLIFSFVGMVYKTWVTPVKGSPGLYNTRVTMGGFSDRIGALAFALTPFTVALSTRESILTMITGVSYQHFNFLHTWCGRVIFIQAFVHTLIWAVIEGHLYQPQPTVGAEFIKQEYMIWGCIAMILLTFLFVGSFKTVINWTGYEFFRKTHYIIAAIYLGACWAHWSQLACWMIASLGIFFIDRILRLARSGLIHVGYLKERGYGFRPTNATMKCFDDDTGSVIRISFSHSQPWRAGQHFFLCFPELSIWQSHPFTVMSLLSPHPQPSEHVYIVRSMSGQTSKLAKLARKKESTGEATSVIMTGPYGTLVNKDAPNLLAIAGGTGISFALPLAIEAASQTKDPGRRVQLVWVIRHSQDLEWVAPELEQLKRLVQRPGSNLHVQIFITRKQQTAAISDSDGNSSGAKAGTGEKTSAVETASRTLHDAHTVFTITSLQGHHPDLNEVVAQFLEQTLSGRTQVIASGPSGMGTDLRRAVARFNDGAKVMKGNGKWDVSLYLDNRFN